LFSSSCIRAFQQFEFFVNYWRNIMPPINGESSQPEVPGVLGKSTTYNGVLGYTTAAGHSGVAGISDEGNGNGVYGRSKNVDGVVGYSAATGHSGVAGVNEQGDGNGVYGRSTKQAGVYGESKGFNGVLGQTTADGHAGVAGVSDEGNSNGVYGRSKNRNGVFGVSSAAEHSGVVGQNDNGTGVLGRSKNSRGVWGLSDTAEGVIAQTRSSATAALAAYQSNPDSNTAALYAKHDGNRTAGFFQGDVEVTGDIRLRNADCAEDFDISGFEKVEPGTVMVIDSESALKPSDRAYDKRVAGVISGAGNYKPGLILDKQESSNNRMPIALMGKVYCKVDASYGAIEVGDLLTTSPTIGYAMKAIDSSKTPGSVIGKVLHHIESGQGLIPILIALQ
jgi:hypothetical protein